MTAEQQAENRVEDTVAQGCMECSDQCSYTLHSEKLKSSTPDGGA